MLLIPTGGPDDEERSERNLLKINRIIAVVIFLWILAVLLWFCRVKGS